MKSSVLIRRIGAAALIGIISLGAGASSASAGQIRPQSLETLTFRASAVVRCIPIAGSEVSLINPDGLLVTQTQFTVLENISGTPVGPEITVEVIGGTLGGGETVTIDQAANFNEAEEVVLFLWRMSSGDPFKVLDLSAGKFEVNRDPNTGDILLTRRDFGEVDEGGGMLLRSQEAAVNIPRDLDSLRAQVAEAQLKKEALLARGLDPLKHVAVRADAVQVFKKEEGNR